MRLDRLSNALRLAEAGYDGYSMSNNARAAYDAGRMPLSKWTKESILSGLKEEYGDSLSSELYDYIKKLPLDFLRKYFLRRTEWHHTSSMYNATDFYGVDDNYLDDAEDTEVSIKQIETDYTKWKAIHDKSREEKKALKDSKGKFCYFKYLVWGGSMAHPVASEEESYGYVKGDWVYFADEFGNLTRGKKGLYSNGTEVLKYLEPKSKE